MLILFEVQENEYTRKFGIKYYYGTDNLFGKLISDNQIIHFHKIILIAMQDIFKKS